MFRSQLSVIEQTCTEFMALKPKYQISSKYVQCETSFSVPSDKRTNGHEETNGGFSQFCERA